MPFVMKLQNSRRIGVLAAPLLLMICAGCSPFVVGTKRQLPDLPAYAQSVPTAKLRLNEDLAEFGGRVTITSDTNGERLDCLALWYRQIQAGAADDKAKATASAKAAKRCAEIEGAAKR